MGETMLGYLGTNKHYPPAAYYTPHRNPAHLPIYHVDNLKYGYTDALGYNKCLFGSTLEVTLMENSIKGEKTA
jgi:hypothetical protein